MRELQHDIVVAPHVVHRVHVAATRALAGIGNPQTTAISAQVSGLPGVGALVLAEGACGDRHAGQHVAVGAAVAVSTVGGAVTAEVKRHRAAYRGQAGIDRQVGFAGLQHVLSSFAGHRVGVAVATICARVFGGEGVARQRSELDRIGTRRQAREEVIATGVGLLCCNYSA